MKKFNLNQEIIKLWKKERIYFITKKFFTTWWFPSQKINFVENLKHSKFGDKSKSQQLTLKYTRENHKNKNVRNFVVSIWNKFKKVGKYLMKMWNLSKTIQNRNLIEFLKSENYIAFFCSNFTFSLNIFPLSF